MKAEKWIVFYHGDVKLAAYTVLGTFDEECEATRKMLAGEHGISEEEIRVVVEDREANPRKLRPETEIRGAVNSLLADLATIDNEQEYECLVHRIDGLLWALDDFDTQIPDFAERRNPSCLSE